MKIALIYPPLESTIQGPISSEVTGISGFPPLHLLSIAACAENIPGVEVKIIDCRLDKLKCNDVCKIISEFCPKIVGISVNTFMLRDALLLSDQIKKLLPSVIIIWGGIHPTIYPRESIAFDSVDFLVRGEGEYAFASLVEAIKGDQDVSCIKGVVTKKTEIPENIEIQQIEVLDKLPPPAWHLVDTSRYVREFKPVLWLLTSRGCVGRCAFCYIPSNQRRYRYNSVSYVIENLKNMVSAYGIYEFYIADDCFTVNKDRVIEFCQEIEKLPYTLKWGAVSRIDTLSEPVMEAMANAGCRNIYLGIESGDANIQKVIGKNLQLDKIEKVVTFAHKLGMNPHGYFMVGHPSETDVEVNNTLNFMKRIPLSGIAGGVAIFQPYPNTAAYELGLKSGVIKNDYWREFAKNPTPEFTYQYWNENFSNQELLTWQRVLNNSFFYRPIIVWRTLVEAIRTGRLVSKIKCLVIYLKS